MMTQDKPFYIPAVAVHSIKSKHVDQTYQIHVMQPVLKRSVAERFPVLYITDDNLAFDFAKGICHCLQSSGQLRRCILVGIGYPGDNPFTGTVLRCRDLTPERSVEIPDLPRSSPIDGVPGIAPGVKNWGGGSDFLAFIRGELIPFIDDKYSTVPGERAYFGHSLGGGLGLHALLSASNIFNKYIISSPSICYGSDEFGFREAGAFIASRKRLSAKVIMTVGDQEEFEPAFEKSHLVSNFYRLAALLLNARIPGLDFTSRVFPGETHVSVWPIAFSHGVQAIFGPAESPPGIFAPAEQT